MVGFSFLSKFWLNLKNSSGEDTFFLRHSFFCINFTNFLINICVDQVVKIWVLNHKKISWSARWYLHDFFEPVSNNASSSSPFNAAVIIIAINIFIFWYFDIFFHNDLALHKDVSSIRISTLHTCVLLIIFFSLLKPKSDHLIDKIFIEGQLAIKTN